MIEKELTPIIKDSFLQFAGAVLQSRALVDVRDCLKPSARQIFYCMETDGFIHSKPFQKTLKSIGSCFRLYIHGDSSAEGVIMRAGQPFAMRYPLVEVEGSYGTLISSSSWAAPRYTSARLSKLSEYLFSDMKKDVISEWRDNYDNTEQYPSILPSKGFYNLVNGAFGLGVGASSSIPQYNIRELNNALIHLIDNPDCDFEEIYCAPDFATGAILYNEEEVKESMKNGTGAACKLRSVVDFDNKDRCFIVTEIPFMVYTETICKELEEIVNSENNPGIERFNDLTGEKPLIKIYLSKKANPDRILKYLYKNTSLQSYYGINFTMLDNGRFPRVFTWKEMLQAHIDHERIVYRRGFEFDLNKIKNRIHIIDGLLICTANIEEVVRIIKGSSSTTEAALELQRRFILDEAQTKAILDMKLSRLAHLEVKKLQNEKAQLEIEKSKIEEILSNEELFKEEIKNGWRETSRIFGDDRRTKIIQLSEDSNNEPIEEKQLSLSLINTGAIYVSETSTLYTQRRNRVGTKFKLDKEEFVINSAVCKSTDIIMFFSNKGNFYHCKASDFEVDTKYYLSNTIKLMPHEKIITLSVFNETKKNIIFITKNGILKKSEIIEYNLKRNTGATAIKLDDNDEIASILFVNNEKIGIASKKGQFIIINTDSINPIGRVTRGVIGMKLNEDDYVISAKVITDNDKQLVAVSEDGYITKTNINDFSVTGRGTKGKKIQKTNLLCDFLTISKNDDIMIISSMSELKIKSSDITLTLPGAIGTKSIKLVDNAKVISIFSV